MNIHTRKHTCLLMMVLLALLLAACGAPAPPPTEVPPTEVPPTEVPPTEVPPEPTPTPEPVSVKVGMFPYVSFAPFYIAEAEGYYAEQGLDVELVQFQRTAEAMAALIQGELDVTGGPINAGFLNGIARGAQIRYVADKGNIDPEGCTYTAFMARSDLVEAGELDSPADLAGRPVSLLTISQSTLGYYMEQLLAPAGLTLEDIEILDLPAPVQMQALEEGTIDVALMGEPFVTMAVGAGYGVIWMPLEQVVPDFQHAATLYGPGLLDNPDAGNRFMVAYLKAVRQYNEGLTERNLELMAEFSGLDQALLEGICLPPIRDNGQINADTILDYQEWAVGQGYLDRVVEEDEFWDPAFVEYASQVLDSGSQ